MTAKDLSAAERTYFSRRLGRIMQEIRDNPETMARIRERVEKNRKAEKRNG